MNMCQSAFRGSSLHKNTLNFSFGTCLVCLFIFCVISVCLPYQKVTAEEPPPLAAGQMEIPQQPENHGPHAGYVSGRGAVLAEIVPEASGNLRIHFIDQNWIELPSSGFKAHAVLKPANGKEQALDCKLDRGSFLCSMPQGFKFSTGDKVTVTREQVVVPPAKYEYSYPFQHAAGQ